MYVVLRVMATSDLWEPLACDKSIFRSGNMTRFFTHFRDAINRETERRGKNEFRAKESCVFLAKKSDPICGNLGQPHGNLNCKCRTIYRDTIMHNHIISDKIFFHSVDEVEGVYLLFYALLFPEIGLSEATYVCKPRKILCKYLAPRILLLNSTFWSSKIRMIAKMQALWKERRKPPLELQQLWRMHSVCRRIICSAGANYETTVPFRDYIIAKDDDFLRDRGVYKLSFCAYCQQDNKIGGACKSLFHILCCLDCAANSKYNPFFNPQKCVYCMQ
jgi:hypothetical protein